MKKRFIGLSVAAVAAGLVASASAQTAIYGTLGPGDAFNTNSFVSFTRGGDLDGFADKFTSPGTENVSSVSIALEAATAGATITLSIHSNSDNAPSGPLGIIGTFSPVTLPTDPAVVTFDATTDFQLNPGTQYWLTLDASSGQTDWFYNDQSIQNFTSAHINGLWDTQQIPGQALAFEVDAVPEPTTLALTGMGAGGLLLFRRRIKAGSTRCS
jgi:hypothetical protein